MASSSQTFDFAGFYLFGALADRLKSGMEPSSADWDGLFSVPGYAALTRSEFKRETLIDRLRLACLPSRAAEREAMLAEGKSMILAHFVEARQRWPELLGAADRLGSTPLQAEAAALACDHLPLARLGGRESALMSPPPVSFLIFAKDARGYVPVVVDVAMAAELSERDLLLMLAHEFHHNYRNRILAYHPDGAPAGTEALIWILDQLQAEGCADLINVPEMIYRPDAPAAHGQMYRDGVAAAPAFLAQFGEALARLVTTIADEPADGDVVAQRQAICEASRQSLHMAGHPAGYYMATSIVAAGLERQLVESVGDPFAFVELYDQAARQLGRPCFSPEASVTLSWLKQSTR